MNLNLRESIAVLRSLPALILLVFAAGCATSGSAPPSSGYDEAAAAQWLSIRLPGGQRAVSMKHGFHMEAQPAAKEELKDFETAAGRGKKTFQTYCVSCHGPEGRGDGPQAKGLARPPANLVARSAYYRKGRFYMVISEGKNAMPSWQDILTKQEIADLTSYIKSLSP